MKFAQYARPRVLFEVYAQRRRVKSFKYPFHALIYHTLTNGWLEWLDPGRRREVSHEKWDFNCKRDM